jgi:hypothetical protein
MARGPTTKDFAEIPAPDREDYIMSLLDALLLEGYAEPREVWVAVRTDGIKGSGTQADPYDGSTGHGPVASATLSYDATLVIAFTRANHGYSTGDIVEISGVTGPSASQFNGAHAIGVVNEHEFTVTVAGLAAPPSGSDLISRQKTDTPNPDPVPYADMLLFWPLATVDTGVVGPRSQATTWWPWPERPTPPSTVSS